MNGIAPHTETLLAALDAWRQKVQAYPYDDERMRIERLAEITAARDFVLETRRAIRRGNKHEV